MSKQDSADNATTFPSHPLLEKQTELNHSTRGQWHLYASHRHELERLLVPETPGRRICILGAGNCNDLDLPWLTQVYREIHLVDLDEQALARAAKFQKVEGSPKLQLRGSIDLTGLAHRLGTWATKSPDKAEIQACLQIAAEPPDTLIAKLDGAGPFDVVVSPCVLSQLLTPLRDTLGEDHPGFVPLLLAMRARHFRLMTRLLAPSGRGVFTCDLFSSATFPALPRIPKEHLADVMHSRIREQRYFSGLSPFEITSVLTKEASLASHIREIQHKGPWLWHLGLSKTYLVYAMTFQKSPQTAGTLFSLQSPITSH